MGLFAFADRCLSGLFGFIIKIMLFLILFTFLIVIIFGAFAYWPFTVSLIIGLVWSLPFYRMVEKKINLKLPDYFFMTLHDFFSSFYEGDEEINVLREELGYKMKEARKETQEMRIAADSLQMEYEKTKKKKSLKNLFSKDPYEISPRMAKALEMELGRPKWAEYVEKAGQSENNDWEKYRV